MTCTYPRNDTKRPVCGRPAIVVYVGPREQHPRCYVHDTLEARLAAPEFGMTRRPVEHWGAA